MTVDYRTGFSIAELCVYTPALLVGIFLAVRPGFGHNYGWFY